MKVSCVSLLTAGRLVTNGIRLSHSFVAYGTASLHVSLITLCVSSDRKY